MKRAFWRCYADDDTALTNCKDEAIGCKRINNKVFDDKNNCSECSLLKTFDTVNCFIFNKPPSKDCDFEIYELNDEKLIDRDTVKLLLRDMDAIGIQETRKALSVLYKKHRDLFFKSYPFSQKEKSIFINITRANYWLHVCTEKSLNVRIIFKEVD